MFYNVFGEYFEVEQISGYGCHSCYEKRVLLWRIR